MSKTQPITAKCVYVMGSILVYLSPEGFAQTVAAKPLTVIRGENRGWRTYYHYIAADSGPIAYCTRTREVLPDVQADIVTSYIIGLSFPPGT